MAPATSIKFIDAALSCSGPLTLSYEEPNRKWIIREHLISLLQEFESLVPSIDTFTYNDGTTVNLLNVNGFLQVSPSTPPIPLTIWIHQNYPTSPPLVFLSSIHRDHPFVDSSGSITSPYLETWAYPRSNLLDLARNLVRLFAHHPTFFSVSATIFSNYTDPSKIEALDRLVATLQSDRGDIAGQSRGRYRGIIRVAGGTCCSN
ncbi:Ubiquitin E2 variant [Macleaya cordata]|uniref:Ubiquitin E2 variant n=1 Tax=Macleaya cordata TaxID=56857 RepID=A0A200Q4H6_MACCD|nr:Ubiquitin E2 variant [Macleaya cordata]